ncbi:MAG: hypothetical protein Q7U98_17150 [Methylicorpusculum sp.]|uniref:hypothetical protein n=1 Tax=Methylicorpusculum sp. TaxID=2713644 RepID=UPI002721E909|nr:hypothetical protein [Methylicorpusculum sp.]MDO8940884.1 hypothetical protein [Methylicorpusculum sp.]MDP2202425.1 hypothetical protein [Methylicorpusculum sp.]
MKELYAQALDAKIKLAKLQDKADFARQRIAVITDNLTYYQHLLQALKARIDELNQAQETDWLGIINCGWSHRKVLRVITALEAAQCSKS